jgi:predicted amidohydrolase YtcJ
MRNPPMLRDYARLHREGRMSVRVNSLLHWEWPSPSNTHAQMALALELSGVSAGVGDDWLRVGGCKLFADGVPSQRASWIYQPYMDGRHGSLVTEGRDDEERFTELARIIALVHRHRLQVQIHTTGDRAADAAIDGIEAALVADPWPESRHALIHGTFLLPKAPRRLADNGNSVITSSLMRAHNRAGHRGRRRCRPLAARRLRRRASPRRCRPACAHGATAQDVDGGRCPSGVYRAGARSTPS